MPSISFITNTGNAYIDGVLDGEKWASSSLTYSFPTLASYYGSGYGEGEQTSGFKALNATQQSVVQKVLANYSAVANVTFTQVTESSTKHGDLRYAESNLPSTAWGYYPSTAAEGGDVWLNNRSHAYDNPILGNYAYATFLHETGHALGLKHPHEAYGTFGAMPADKDSLEYSVMSYHSYVGGSTSGGYTNGSYSFPQSLMMYDIAAVQVLYGANYNTNSSDSIYKWSPTTGEESINGVGLGAPGGNKIFQTVWDGGGNDTYDFSNYTTNLKVDLSPGGWTTLSSTQLANLSSSKVAVGNIANALLYQDNPASLIENAIGGSGNDVLIANAIANQLTGGKGNDSLDGGGGTDTAIFSGLQSSYRIVQNSDGSWTVTDLRGTGFDGTDTLKNIELAKFSDGTVTLGSSTNPPTDPPQPPTGTNHAPVAVDDSATTKEDTAVTITVLANDTDADGNPLSISGVPTALHGSVTVNSNGTLRYTPNANYNGADTINYGITDGSLTATGHVAVNVTAVNDLPVAQADAYSTGRGQKLTVSGTGVLGNDSDPDGGGLSAVLVTKATHGVVKLNADGTFTYTPSTFFRSGTDSFTYKDSDGQGYSNTVKVTINVGGSSAQSNASSVSDHPNMADDQIPALMDWHEAHDHHQNAPAGLDPLLHFFHHDHGFGLT